MNPHLRPDHSEHLTEDQLIQRLYGLDNDPHLAACPECQGRWAQIEQSRAAQVAEMTGVEQPPNFFATQLQRIQERIERMDQPPAPWLALRSVWVPATLAVLLAAVLLYSRVSPFGMSAEFGPSTEEAALIEATWFDEAYESLGTLEPRAASPIRELFAEETVE